jgi:hypothetical protein
VFDHERLIDVLDRDADSVLEAQQRGAESLALRRGLRDLELGVEQVAGSGAEQVGAHGPHDQEEDEEHGRDDT